MSESRIKKIQSLSASDYLHEWQMSICFVLALAAVLAPLMVLFGLKFGIVNTMLEDLVQNPQNREIRPVLSGHFTREWIDEISAREDVAFMVPRTRALAATMDLQNVDIGKIISVELIPSGEHDPLLTTAAPFPRGYDGVVLSHEAARRLNLSPGDPVGGSLVRRYGGKRERVHRDMRVLAIAPEESFTRPAAFVSSALMDATEDFRDGRAVPALDWKGQDASDWIRQYPGFRLYARSIDDVIPLRDLFEEAGIQVKTKAADIAVVKRIDENLSMIFWIIALVGITGFSLSLGASLWANVDRKQRELSVLRLVGFRSLDIVGFPFLQALYTGFLGWGLASLLYLALQSSINGIFTERTICILLPPHFAAALGITLLAALTAAVLGGMRAVRIEPSEGLREV